MPRRIIGGIKGEGVENPFGQAPSSGFFDKYAQFYAKTLGSWVVSTEAYEFTITSAPGPSGDTGRVINLKNDTPDGSFEFPSQSTYEITFPTRTTVSWEICGNGAQGGRGSSFGGSGKTNGIPGGPSKVSSPAFTAEAGGGTGGPGGEIGTPNGSPGGGGGGGTASFSSPNPLTFQGTVTTVNGQSVPGGGSSGGNGSPGGSGAPTYQGIPQSRTPTSATAGQGGAGGGSANPGAAGGGGGGGAGSGAYISVANFVSEPGITFTVTTTGRDGGSGPGLVRIVGVSF